MDGLRVGVTSARKGAELVALLERRGAAVTWGPTLQIVWPASDRRLRAETEALVDRGTDWFAASTGAGMRAWLEAAERWGMGEAVRGLLKGARTTARGAKAAGALRLAGAEPAFQSPRETDADVTDWLAGELADGDAVAVQTHGADRGEAFERLAARGARLARLTPYRCAPPDDPEPALRLVLSAAEGDLDLVAATSAPAVENLFALADSIGALAMLRGSLNSSVAVAAVGPVTAQAFECAGAPVSVMPRRARTGDLVRAIEAWAARRETAGTPHMAILLDPVSRVARVDGRAVALGEREFDVLAALVRRPQIVCEPELLAREAWGHCAPDDVGAAVKHHIARLRRKLGPVGVRLRTVRQIGYSYDPTSRSGTPNS